MHRRWYLILSVAVIVVTMAFVVTLRTVSAVSEGNRPSASGHGNLSDQGELRTFSFHAFTRKDGSISGNATLHNRDLDVFSKMDIDCMVVDGNRASLSGPITAQPDDPSLVGVTAIFTIEENGEGKNADPDRMSYVYPYPVANPPDCTDAAAANFPFPMLEIEGGNIQLRP